MATFYQKNKTKILSTKNFNTNQNQKISLLSHFKKIEHLSFRSIKKITELLKQEEFKNYSLEPPELIAIIALLPKRDHFKVLELIKKKLGIQLSYLEIEKLKVHLSKEQDFSKLFALFSKFSLQKVLFTIKNYNLNVRLEKFKALAKQYQLNFSNSDPLEMLEFFQLFPKENWLELIKIPEVWVQIKIKFAVIGKRPALPLNHKETLMLLKKLDEICNLQNFLKKFSLATGNDQINLLLKFQRDKPKLLTEYLKANQNITELCRLIAESSMLKYLKLPFIASAIDKVTFSWNDIIDILGQDNNRNAYLFIGHLLAKNKLTETIDIEQLKILLMGLNYENYEKRLDFFNSLKFKQLITSEINIGDTRLVDLFPIEDQLNNNVQQRQRPLSFWNKDKAYKHKMISSPSIKKEGYESNSGNKKIKFS